MARRHGRQERPLIGTRNDGRATPKIVASLVDKPKDKFVAPIEQRARLALDGLANLQKDGGGWGGLGFLMDQTVLEDEKVAVDHGADLEWASQEMAMASI